MSKKKTNPPQTTQNTNKKARTKNQTHTPPQEQKKKQISPTPQKLQQTRHAFNMYLQHEQTNRHLRKAFKMKSFSTAFAGFRLLPPAHPQVRTATQVPSLPKIPALSTSLRRQHLNSAPIQLWNTAGESEVLKQTKESLPK